MGYIATRHFRLKGYGHIEITYGKDFIGDSVLTPKYAGEFEEFDDPRAAVETAILIKNLWQHDEPDISIDYVFGSPIDQRVACIGTVDAENLRKWALDTVRHFPVCEWCKEIIYKPDNIYSYREHPGIVFCSQAHGVMWKDDTEAADKEIAANRAKW
jgi:hypothetical protein